MLFTRIILSLSIFFGFTAKAAEDFTYIEHQPNLFRVHKNKRQIEQISESGEWKLIHYRENPATLMKRGPYHTMVWTFNDFLILSKSRIFKASRIPESKDPKFELFEYLNNEWVQLREIECKESKKGFALKYDSEENLSFFAESEVLSEKTIVMKEGDLDVFSVYELDPFPHLYPCEILMGQMGEHS